MRNGVPAELRRLALRRLWRSNPVFANLDGLNDYDEDYSALGIVAEQVSSLFQPGKGMVDPEDEDEADDREAQVANAEPEAESTEPPEDEQEEEALSAETEDGEPLEKPAEKA